MRTHALRLSPGQDLRLALEEATLSLGLAAGCVLTCVGSLVRARLRLAGSEQVLELEGPLEIVALVGTLSPDGPHLHAALADGEGRVLGGHVLAGCLVHTTAELVLGELEGLAFARAQDPATGWRELVVRSSRPLGPNPRP
ncbi:MAG TPA: PPC domain-containing DNA-binding protein [Planctomycetota bacterium]